MLAETETAPAPLKVFFQPKREDRGKYFVEYHPPQGDAAFANLNVVCVEPMTTEEVVQAIEKELDEWTGRYPVPIMAVAFDDTDDAIDLKPLRSTKFLIGWRANGSLVKHWRLIENKDFPNGPFRTEQLLAVYPNFEYKTSEQTRRDVERLGKQMQLLHWGVVIVYVAVPVAIIIVGAANVWVGYAASAYSLWKAFDKWCELTGRKKKSPKQLEKERDDTLMRHHHYHCKLNPEGFNRLRNENFEREARGATRREAAELKR